MSIAAILLASQPLDSFDVAPALLPFGGDRTLVEYCVGEIGEALRACGEPHGAIEVVLGCDGERVIPLLSGDAEPIVDAAWQSGEASAVRIGATAVPRGTTAALVARVTQPQPASLYIAALEHHLRAPSMITRASTDRNATLPIVAGDAALAELRNLADAADALAAWLARHAGDIADARLSHTIDIFDHATLARARAILSSNE